jgi:hypothetical protein
MVGVLVLPGCSTPAASPITTPTGRSPSTTSSHLTPISQPPGPVPAQYQAQYAQIQTEVQTFAAQAGTPPRHPSTTVGTELLAANGNIGSGLLAPSAIPGVIAELDAFSALGVQGVTVDVSFPLLLPTTGGSSAYRSFYEQVAQQVRAHHLVLSVEENPIFSGTPLTSLSISYAGLTLDTYGAEQREQAQIIIDDLDPTYLSLLDETDTFSTTLGINLDTPATAVQVVNDELTGLRRGHTEVGAGTGSWTAPTIDQSLLAQTSIDYLGVHVYPLGPAQTANLRTDVDAAAGAHKGLVMDETWLEKPTAAEVAGAGPQGAAEELKIKSYSFWEPLDEQFVTEMVNYARAQGFSYISFFDGSRAFFGYLPWSTQLEAASYEEFSREYNQVVAANMRGQVVSGSGLALHRAIGGT